jgi:hypothetical protein
MDHPPTGHSTELRPSDSVSLRRGLAKACRFWAPRRIHYNLLLLLVAATWVVATWPHFRPAFALVPMLQFAGLALLANVCYSAAYLVDLLIQLSVSSARWAAARGALWVAGMLLAILLENYWIGDEIYPFVR